jgi:hypothetical protein
MSLLGDYGNDPSQLANLLQAYQQQNWAPMVQAAQQQQQGGMPAAQSGYMPFGFQPPQVPQSQFQPYQMSTGQAYGLNPMATFMGDVTQSRNLYNSLGQGGGTTPTTPPGTTPTTPPPATPPINYGTTLPPNGLGWVPGASTEQMQKIYDAFNNNGMTGLLLALKQFKRTPDYQGESSYGSGFE